MVTARRYSQFQEFFEVKVLICVNGFVFWHAEKQMSLATCISVALNRQWLAPQGQGQLPASWWCSSCTQKWLWVMARVPLNSKVAVVLK